MRRIVKYSGMIAIGMVVTMGLTACGNPFSKPDSDQVKINLKGDTLWEASNQYVRIVDQDISTTPNDQPVSISPADMRTVLESLYLNETVLLKSEQNPVFNASELQVLSMALSQGLSKAKPNQDVNFVILGTRQGVIAKEPVTDSGRVFYKNGRLNIIFGLLHQDYEELDKVTGQPIDRRLNPLLPGTRKKEADLNGHLVLDKGQSFYIDPKTGKERTDWIVIDIPTVIAAAKAKKADENSGLVSPQMREDIAHNKRDVTNMRDDMANMKEMLFDMSEQIDKLKKEVESLKK